MAPRKNTFKQPPKASFHFTLSAMHITELLVSAAIVTFTVALLVLVSLGVIYAYKKVTTSSYFSLNTIQVTGNSHLSHADVLAAGELRENTNTFTVRLYELEGRLRANPWIRTVEVKRRLPSALEITIAEHEPRFWIMQDDALYYADAKGMPIDAVSAGRLISLPTLHVEPGADRLRSILPAFLADIENGRLSLSGGLAWIRLSRAKGIECKLEGIDMMITLGVENYTANAVKVALVLADLERRGEKSRVRNIHAAGANVWISRGTAGG